MATTLADFASAAERLVTTISNKNDNGVQVAVVGGFDGVPCPTTERPFYDTRVDKAGDIAAAIAGALTAEGASTGELLELAQAAVYQMDDGGCLAGFLRPGTSLHVLLLSNGSEDSSYDPSMYAQSILNQVTGPLGGTGAEISAFVPGGQDCSDEGCTRLIQAADDLERLGLGPVDRRLERAGRFVRRLARAAAGQSAPHPEPSRASNERRTSPTSRSPSTSTASQKRSDPSGTGTTPGCRP
jgi:hypothetical protein